MFVAADFEAELQVRAQGKCEICESEKNVRAIEVTSGGESCSLETCVLICETCLLGIRNPDSISEYHWNCLQGAIWSEHIAVQVLCWRILQRFATEGWAQDLLSQLYLDEDTLAWAEDDGAVEATLDSNGEALQDGDSVHIIKDLDVKGASFVAKRGTTVRNIRLSPDPEYIQGKVNGTQLMLKTCFVKKI